MNQERRKPPLVWSVLKWAGKALLGVVLYMTTTLLLVDQVGVNRLGWSTEGADEYKSSGNDSKLSLFNATGPTDT